LEFDNPVSAIGVAPSGMSVVAGGGPYRIGKHAMQSVVYGFSPTHPLLVTVTSELPVQLVEDPRLE
jgi:hypothetical protein